MKYEIEQIPSGGLALVIDAEGDNSVNVNFHQTFIEIYADSGDPASYQKWRLLAQIVNPKITVIKLNK